jgi:phosphoribosyl 1,2-cyclic phosphodiesterase
MSFHFTVLASGSGGNASFLEVAGRGYLLDIGLGPRQIAQRLAVQGANWNCVHAVLLTHTHADHWKESTLRHLHRRSIPIYCHLDHHEDLSLGRGAFELLRKNKLVRCYETGKEFHLAAELRCCPFVLSHDSRATYGFRFDAWVEALNTRRSLAYAADLGCWDDVLAEAFSGVDLLALEFNHDVDMEYASGRPAELIARILGERGHLSNQQAAALLAEILRRDERGRLCHLVQLHLSRECNDPELAAEEARAILERFARNVQVHTASPHGPSPRFELGRLPPPTTASPSPHPKKTRGRRALPASCPYLPGMEP